MHDTCPINLAPQAWLFGNLYFNLCCIRGSDATILIEVGVSAVVDAVIGQMEERDLTPDYLVVTHPHSDHLTGLEGLRQRFPRSTVIAGPDAVKFFTHPKSAQSIVLEDSFMADRLAELGWQTERQPVDRPPDEAGLNIMVEADELDLGGRIVRFIETRGHSPGSLAAWVPELDLLIASDALGFRYLDGSILPLYFTGIESYMDTLERLASYCPKILCLGHQGPLFGRAAIEAFDVARTAALRMQERVQGHSGSDDALADVIFREVYRDELQLYSEQNIRNCVRLLIHRSRQA